MIALTVLALSLKLTATAGVSAWWFAHVLRTR